MINYVYFFKNLELVPSLLEKAYAQAHSIRIKRLDMQIIVINFSKCGLDQGVQFVKLKKKFFKHYFFNYAYVADVISKLNGPVCLRYLFADFSSRWFYKMYGHRIVTDHHTNEYHELLLNGFWLKKWMRCFLEKYANGLKYALGHVAVTQEILDYECHRSGCLNGMVISNGENDDLIMKHKSNFFDWQEGPVQLIFVASAPFPWNGIERLLVHSPHSFTRDICIHLVGPFSDDTLEDVDRINALNGQVKFVVHGVLDHAGIEQLASSVHLGVGTLGLYKKGLNEGSTLKIRHYLFLGLPVLIGYHEADLMGQPFVFHAPNNDTKIDFQGVVDFVENWYQKYSVSESRKIICRFAQDNLLWEKKLNDLVKFVSRLL